MLLAGNAVSVRTATGAGHRLHGHSAFFVYILAESDDFPDGIRFAGDFLGPAGTKRHDLAGSGSVFRYRGLYLRYLQSLLFSSTDAVDSAGCHFGWGHLYPDAASGVALAGDLLFNGYAHHSTHAGEHCRGNPNFRRHRGVERHDAAALKQNEMVQKAYLGME